MKTYLLFLTTMFFLQSNLLGQESIFKDIEYTVIAEGIDSPFENLQVVCFNKYFNLEGLPKEFQIKYNLTDRQLFKRKMLVEIFFSDTENKGLDKIEIAGIRESNSEIIVEYNIMNADNTNDSIIQSPFIVIQIPKSARKKIQFIANGQKQGETQKGYIIN